MPDFPKKGATAAEVWAESARTITALTGQPRTDLLGEDATFEAGTGVRKAKIDNVDVAITTRATPAQILVNPVNKVDGSLIDASVASRVADTDFDTRLSDTRAAKIDNVDAAVSTRAAPLDILVGVDKIDGAKIDATIGSRAAESGGRLDSIPAFLVPVESSVLMDGTIKTLVEITDVKAGQVEAWVDLTPMGTGDTIVIRYSRKMSAAGAYVKYAEETYSGAQSIPALCILNKMIYRDTLVTAQQTAIGTYRTLDIQVIRTRTV